VQNLKIFTKQTFNLNCTRQRITLSDDLYNSYYEFVFGCSLPLPGRRDFSSGLSGSCREEGPPNLDCISPLDIHNRPVCLLSFSRSL
jgi:hypothetical protein